MCTEAPISCRDPAIVLRVRARLALIRSLLDELERHVARDARGGIELEWACPVANQLADEAAGLSKLVMGLPESESPPSLR
ncbi:MAG: hypothetical protein IPF92_23975 [Myxococcales bacterium]|jgi:hypothetical protein|nr:hypothetical protein [Myxococcales bacterium]MBL0193398.1 hypothetical protein [Myxococcales bacterium]HQY62937.1 hypothetical protein [Polyangiaceae bacterium]